MLLNLINTFTGCFKAMAQSVLHHNFATIQVQNAFEV